MIEINEKTSLKLILGFKDGNNTLVEPTSVDYNVIVEDSNIQITDGLGDLIKIDSENGPTYELLLSKEDNRIVDENTMFDEIHTVIIDWAFNDGSEGEALKYEILVKNI